MALYGIANRPCMCSSCMMNTRAPDGANKFGWLISNLQVPLEGCHPVLYHNTDLREIYNALQCHAIPSIQHHAIPCNTNAIPSNGWHPSTLLCWILLQHITILYWSHEAFFWQDFEIIGISLYSLCFLKAIEYSWAMHWCPYRGVWRWFPPDLRPKTSR